MRYLTSANNLFTATLWQRMLENGGIRCHIRNQFIGGAMGEIPADQVSPQLWVEREEEYDEARRLIAALRQPPRGAGWHCPQCGEFHAQQFGQCWNCGTDRPAEDETVAP